MVGSGKKDRLAPPLMFAFRSANAARDAKKKIDLRDEAGERIIASRRTTGRTAITENMLRKEVARDLESLMNTIALESSEDIGRFDRVRKSILNYGLPDIAHRTIDENGVHDVLNELKTALLHYEPRLIPQTIHVARDTSLGVHELKVRFVVRADLSCEPVNVPVEFVADIELDSGKIQVDRL
jgi:type VI secretion system protein ImpF